jgi:hypothetical protein
MPTAADTFLTPPIGAPGPALPEAPWPVLLVVLAGGVIAASSVIRRRRSA